MEIKVSEFITSAVKANQYPVEQFPEVAFIGKSNVGKSSLINSLTNRKKLAKVSSTPGKTRLINFFLINNDCMFVDLPGYGYAKVAKDEKANWGKMVETYLRVRENLKKVILLIDCRHKPTEDDVMMYEWIKHYGYDCIVVFTKIDKVTKNEMAKNNKLIRDTLKISSKDKVVYYSSLKKLGKEELIDCIFEDIVATNE